MTPGASAQDAGLPVVAHDRPRRAALEMCGISALILSIAKCCLLALKEKRSKKDFSKPQPPRQALSVLSLKNSSILPAQRIISERMVASRTLRPDSLEI